MTTPTEVTATMPTNTPGVPGTGERERLAAYVSAKLESGDDAAHVELLFSRDDARALLSALEAEGRGEPVEYRLEMRMNADESYQPNGEWVPRDRWSAVPEWATDMVRERPDRWRLTPLYTHPPRAVSEEWRKEYEARKVRLLAAHKAVVDYGQHGNRDIGLMAELGAANAALDAHVLGGEG